MSPDEPTVVDVCATDELPPGTCRIVAAHGRRFGVFNVRGAYYALLDRCPHGGAPLCKGRIGGMTVADAPGTQLDHIRDGEILRCPWHGWEFEIATGATITKPTLRVKTFRTRIEAGRILVEV
jgi:nitrite reductase/ring-hydroxylating ferredoxin subunit